VFTNGPSEYAFEVASKFRGRTQVIDITDDTTGECHAIAKKNMLMYVNEVGHLSDKEQNVHIKSDENDNAILYYFHAKTPMLYSESVELFTDYFTAYEQSREQHGYGWQNLLGKSRDVLSDKLIDRADERMTVREFILNRSQFNFNELVDFLEFLSGDVWGPLSRKALDWVAGVNAPSPLSPRQWVAIRKMLWLREAFEERLSIERGDRRRVAKSIEYCETRLSGFQKHALQPALHSAELSDPAIRSALLMDGTFASFV